MTNLTKDSFEQEVLNSKGYVLVDFWGDNCGMCAALAPEYESLASLNNDDVKFTKFNTKESIKVAMSQRVLGLPTVILYKDGEKIEQLIKDKATKENIQKILEKYL